MEAGSGLQFSTGDCLRAVIKGFESRKGFPIAAVQLEANMGASLHLASNCKAHVDRTGHKISVLRAVCYVMCGV